MAAYAKRNVAMLTTVGAMVVAVLLIIFFGAWAVAASSEAGAESLLTNATAGFSGGLPAPPASYPANGDAGDGDAGADADTAPRLATAPDGSIPSNPADTWWGKAFLAACPLH